MLASTWPWLRTFELRLTLRGLGPSTSASVFPRTWARSFFLPRIIGITRAKELIYTGRIIAADEALQIGVVSEVVPASELTDAAGRQASELAKGPTIAIGFAKENIQEHLTMSIESTLRSELRAGLLCMETADHREGLEAVNEKRQPEFHGR